MIRNSPPGSATLRENFKNPPPGFGEVGFYWWNGGRLDRERMRWQLDRLAGAKISGLQVNYAHGPTGGISWGLTYPSDPPLFSEAWWELFAWFKAEANARGMAVSLSDYTLGIGQGWICDEIVRDPALRGSVLEAVVLEAGSELSATWTPDTLAAYAVGGAGVRRLGPFSGGVLAPRDERLVLVRAVVRPRSIDPMNPAVGREYVARFFQPFEDRFPGECGKGLNFFFSDELDFGVAGNLWTPRFAEEFLRRKGYDLMDELPGLFVDIGPRTPKVRLDYRDVMVALQEEAFFRPVFDWHEARGMTFGCDHGWRGARVTEFGDYFRTQRWNQGPGCDQPRLEADVVKNKVASSIAHLNRRPRTWLEGFYSSGWGTTSAQVADAVFRNFAMGHNLLTLHGLYYSTHGGWWEWAPPCNHFRMPYWEHFLSLLDCTERLSYLLSRGAHVCDVAIHYPVAAIEAGADGAEVPEEAFALARALYAQGVDFDFVDFESLATATAADGRLRIGEETYRTLVLPSGPAIRFACLDAAAKLADVGGHVVFLGRLPEATEREGRMDPAVAEKLDAIGAVAAIPVDAALALLVGGERDFRVLAGAGVPHVQHRRIDGRDLFFVYGLEPGALCEFRATGRVTAWDPWDGAEAEIAIESASSTHTRLRLPEMSPCLLWFGPGEARRAEGVATAMVEFSVPERWTLEPVPCLDNRWGDFRLPAFDDFIGPEIREIDVATAEGDEAGWQRYRVGCGPVYEWFGPVSEELRANLVSGEARGGRFLDASWRFGLPDDAGFQGWHGLKGRVNDELFILPESTAFLRTTVVAPRDGTARWITGGVLPVRAWVDGQPTAPDAAFPLTAGTHSLLLEYEGGGRGFAVPAWTAIEPVAAEPPWTGPLQTRWFNNADVLRPAVAHPGPSRIRLHLPPGTRGVTIGLRGGLLETSAAEAVVAEIARDAARFPEDGTRVWTLRWQTPLREAAELFLLVDPLPGTAGGQVVPEPVSLDVAPLACGLGDWAELPGFEWFSGGMRYVTEFDYPEAGPARLDLGNVSASAAVTLNGNPVGVRCAPPWCFPVEMQKGRNHLEVEVRSALANHYKTIPTEYRGSERCGLFGPVRVIATPA